MRLDLVRAKALFCEETIDHQIAERAGVAAGLPDFGMHDERGLQTDDILAQQSHRAPPEILDVALQFGPERAVIPEAVEAAVNLGGLKNQALSFAEGNDFLH